MKRYKAELSFLSRVNQNCRRDTQSVSTNITMGHMHNVRARQSLLFLPPPRYRTLLLPNCVASETLGGPSVAGQPVSISVAGKPWLLW